MHSSRGSKGVLFHVGSSVRQGDIANRIEALAVSCVLDSQKHSSSLRQKI